MHPLFTRLSRLGLYLLAWVPLMAASTYALVSRASLNWVQATMVAVPVFLLYAFLCLLAWYPCRGTPIGKVSFIRLLVTHLVAAGLITSVWIQICAVYTYALLKPEKIGPLTVQYKPQLPTVYTIGMLLYLLSVAFHYVLIGMEESRRAETQANEARVLARDAELKALKAQVNPHFLFNSLNSISALTSVDPAKAREMCILLSEFLRMTLGLGEKSVIPLSEELALLDRFLAIEKVRFGSRLQMTENITDDCKNLLIPPLLLQPLVENAVKHGIANLPEGGKVHLAAECENGRLSISIENTFDPEATPTHRNGMGLANVRQRLDARYPKLSSLRVTTTADQFQVNLSLPAEPQEIAS